MVLSAPISYPFSLALDWLVGKEGRDVYDRKTLRALITMQRDLTKGNFLIRSEDKVKVIEHFLNH